MGESRFERYVRAQLKEQTAAKRAALVEAYRVEVARIETKVKALEEIATEGLKALNAKIDAAARKMGWHVNEGSDPAVETGRSFGSACGHRFVEAQSEYDYTHGTTYRNGPAKEARDALDAFDAAVEKAATRLVVVKMDLGMKADAFDKALADAVAKLLK